MKRFSIVVLCLFLFTTLVCAQNSIDDAVNRYSVVGSFHYTSTVERDPKTRQIKRVIKELSVDNGLPGPCEEMQRLFEKEKKNADLDNRFGDDTQHYRMLVFEKQDCVRVYKLSYTDRKSFKVMIVFIPKS